VRCTARCASSMLGALLNLLTRPRVVKVPEPAISAGEWITAAGDWVNDRTHGQQFKG
jgi:hypothetical protein